MKKVIFPVLINAFTLIGGHFVIQKWGRAVTIFSLLVIWLAVTWVYFSSQISAEFSKNDNFNQIRTIYDDFGLVSLIGIGIFWVASMVLLLYKFPAKVRPIEVNITLAEKVGGTLLSLMCTTLIIYQFIFSTALSNISFNKSDQGSTSKKGGWVSKSFYNNVYYGEDRDVSSYHGVPKIGKGYLNGKILYKGKPVKNVTLDVTLNNKFEVKNLVTNDNGVFSIRVDPGVWFINKLNTSEWEDKPEGNFLLVSGYEKNYRPKNYFNRDYNNKKGLKVNVTESSENILLTLEIKPNINVVWPVKDKKITKAATEKDIISWEDVDNAGKYLVEISSIDRSGSSTSWRTIVTKTITESSLPLSSIKTVPSEGQKQEYGVDITAFTDDDRYITESDFSVLDRTFTVNDGRMLAEADITEYLSTSYSDIDYQAARKEKEKSKAIKVLIREGMLNEANQLLVSLNSEIIDPGEGLALRGYLEATKGRCSSANELFNEAKNAGGKSCVPASYYVNCSK